MKYKTAKFKPTTDDAPCWDGNTNKVTKLYCLNPILFIVCY